MTREKQFCEELRALFKWEAEEKDKITFRLKAEGKYKIGLDANSESYATIRTEFKRHWRAILEKYKDLPLDTKLKLW